MDLGTVFNQYDFFATPAPRFHLQGHAKIGTVFGCLFSILVVIILTTYTGFRSVEMVTGARPAISSYT